MAATALSCSTRWLSRHLSTESKGTHRLSTVHRGARFEHRAQALLQEHLSMSLRRVGGKDDGGIDLQGWWWLPPSTINSSTPESVDGARFGSADDAGIHRRRIRVFAQCKAERKKLGPKYVREMEGVLHRHLHMSNNHPLSNYDTSNARARQPTVALLVSESPFTKAALLRALSSPVPFLLLRLPPLDEADSEDDFTARLLPKKSEEGGGFGSAIWNPALGGRRGLLGGEIELRWEQREAVLDEDCPSVLRGRPGLWWHGTRITSWLPPEMSETPSTA